MKYYFFRDTDMKANRKKFKQFVTEQLKDYDEWREASPDGYAETITDEAVKLFCQPAVMWRWFAYTHDDDLPFEEHNFTDFNEMKRFSARHSAIYKTETNKYRSGYERINAT